MIKEAIQKIVNRENLTEKEAIEVMQEVMSGQTSESQIASFITALRMKGETVEEITGCAKVMREFATRIEVKRPAVNIDRDDINIDYETIVDTCGTGGDSTKTFNISTATAFVVAGTDTLVAKHGNRSVSSTCGSADVIERLGIKLELTKESAEECLSKIGIVFLFAPIYHTAMKYAIGPRRQIGIRTIFNILGPLSNPANATAQVLGIYEKKLVEPIAYVLKNLGVKHAFVVYGEDSLDEISITGKTYVAELVDEQVKMYYIRPEDFGLKRAKLDEIHGGDAEENAGIILDILKGKKGPKRDIVLMNSSAAFITCGKAKNFKDGVKLAEEAIDSGKALRKLEVLKEFTSKL
ncbi:MAG: anthranilate phosphoribosyltransferase [Elusimicrobia bacterium CG1_02_37_114]|nr:MAG: anthranilate phosphoribosyltransferase [Elusimicrobia bacterium CG1_02_37_114]